MSFDAVGTDESFVAAADLSANQYRFVKLGSSGVALVGTAGNPITGVLQNKPAAAGRGANVRTDGVSKILAGAAVAVGAYVGSDAQGRAITATAARVNTSDGGAAADPLLATFIGGEALEAAANAGEIIAVRLRIGMVLPTTFI